MMHIAGNVIAFEIDFYTHPVFLWSTLKPSLRTSSASHVPVQDPFTRNVFSLPTGRYTGIPHPHRIVTFRSDPSDRSDLLSLSRLCSGLGGTVPGLEAARRWRGGWRARGPGGWWGLILSLIDRRWFLDMEDALEHVMKYQDDKLNL